MRNRSISMVVRDNRILMVQTYRRGCTVWELPGGGIEANETPEEAALRELKEECGLDGCMIRLLSTLHGKDGSVEYAFLVDVSAGQEPAVGTDPEASPENPSIQNVCWKRLDELSEGDRAFLWSHGLMEVDGFQELVFSWSNQTSYPR
ncbi:MAG: NUDIX domain-containing protein [Clostridia bacterium]|nr:NUDIX domain-containing protein [Clostridia bacterium]